MRRAWRRSLALAMVMSAPVLGTGQASARSFGSNPYNDVITAATNTTKCSGLTTSKLAAMVFAPTWPEAAGGSTSAPSPMTLGRGDAGLGLYSYDNTPRAFWHAGIGAWQLDPAGLAAHMAAFQSINTSSASNKAAATMASTYCNTSGTAQQRRAAAWGPWLACGSTTCENIYQAIYCSATDTVCNLTKDTSVGSWGGMGKRNCKWNVPGGAQFVCWFIKYQNAQGVTSSWVYDPLNGATKGNTPSPLAIAFYNYWITDSNSVLHEYRSWIKADTGYSRGEVFGNRVDGTNPRSSLVWAYATNGLLCDISNNRGNC